jgi:hypothetical protein
LDIRQNTIQFDYDPTAPGQITADQLQLMAQVRKTESVLKAIFYPKGLPLDLKLRKPAGPVIRVPHHAAHVATSVAAIASSHAARAQQAKDAEDAQEDAQQAKDNKQKTRALVKKAKFRSYYMGLFLLAQIGLDGSKPQPFLANASLESLKDQVMTLEGGRVKNGYMQDLGTAAIVMAGPPLAVLLIFRQTALLLRWKVGLTAVVAKTASAPYLFWLVPVFLYAWVGAMLGTFLSFALRNPVLTFDQLAVPEADRMNPRMRLVYVGLLTLVIVIALSYHAMSISLGGINTNQFPQTPSLAFIIGVFCGISERAMGDKLVSTADAMAK